MSNSSSYDPLVNRLSQQLGSDPERVKKAVQSRSVDDVLRTMNAKDAERIRSVLGNKAELERIMNSDAARSLMKKLSEGH